MEEKAHPSRKETRVMITHSLLNPGVNRQIMADSFHANLKESKMDNIEEDKENED